MAARRRALARPRGPLLLALETSGAESTVALLRGETLLAERRAAAGRPGSEGLLPAIDALLRRARVAPGDLEGFAISAGPGSFTGLRVGIATLKGIAFGSAARVAPVPTLAALARRAPRTRDLVVAVLDARRDEVYAAGFACDGEDPRAEGPEEGLYAPGALAALLPPRCVLVGDGVAVCGDAARAARGEGVRCVGPPRGRPRARDVGALGARMLARGEGLAAAELLPRYGRRAEAELRRERAAAPAGGSGA